MEAVIAKLEEQGTDDEVIASYKEQMTSAQRSQLDNLSRTVNKYGDVPILTDCHLIMRQGIQTNIVVTIIYLFLSLPVAP